MIDVWNILIQQPMINLLFLLYAGLFQNFAVAIVGLTIVVRLLTQPLNRQQLRSTKAMQELQPELQALQKKYAKDREKLTEETMKMYRGRGINPLGGCLPLVIQMPIWIALYQAIIQVLGSAPEQLLSLFQFIYPPLHDLARQVIPINNHFLWLRLDQPDPGLPLLPFLPILIPILPIIVVVTTWVQQKMVSVPVSDPQQASMTQTMQWMMPIMFGWFTLSVPSGLALYWVTSGLIGIITQYFTTGWGGLRPKPTPARAARNERKREKKPRG